MAEKKMTKRDYFAQLKEIVKGNIELENFIDHEVELLNKKSSTKTPTKVQVANEGLKKVIVDTLTELAKPSTIVDLQSANEELASLSNQKVSALLTQLVNANIIVRVVEKKKAYFSINA